MRGSRLRALHAFSASTTTGPPAVQHAPSNILRARRFPPTPLSRPPRPDSSPSATVQSSARPALAPYSPSAPCSSRRAGLRLEDDDDGGDRLPMREGEGDDAVGVPLTCSEGRLAFKRWWGWRWGRGRACKARCLQLRRDAGARTLALLAERGRHAGEAEDRVHLRVHRHWLAVPARAHLRAVVVRAVVVVAARDDLAALDEDGAEGEAHRALGRRIGALREVELRLAHDDSCVCCLQSKYLRESMALARSFLLRKI